MKIGVLALQGDFREHIQILRYLGAEASEVRLPAGLEGLDGLIIPGGESTTIGKIAGAYGLIEPLRAMAQAGKPLWGTCAGLILLARDIGGEAPYLGLLDVRVRRNAFGRQVDSFETDLDVPALSLNGGRSTPPRPFHAVFIRAPLIESAGAGVDVLAGLDDGTVVAARQGRLLATSFHPELTDDTRFHQYFLDLAAGRRQEG